MQCLAAYIGYCVPGGYKASEVNCTPSPNTLVVIPVVVKLANPSDDPYNLDQGGVPGYGCEQNPDPNGFLTTATPHFTG